MGKGLPRSLARARQLNRQNLLKQIFSVKAGAFTVDGLTGIGFGSFVIGGLPEGNILILGAACYLKIDGPGADADLSDTWSGDFGVGTTPASDGTITAGDVDIIPTTAIGPATAELQVRTRAPSTAAPFVHDNTDGSLEVNVNVLVDDADIGADGISFVITGEVHLVYVVLGDD